MTKITQNIDMLSMFSFVLHGTILPPGDFFVMEHI